MTCYETLRASAPATDAPMAHHFVKWWRNKFRNGYKKFSIGTDSERTDTEELVGRAASQCSAPPDLLPSEVRARLQPVTPPPRSRGYESHEPAYRSPAYELAYKPATYEQAYKGPHDPVYKAAAAGVSPRPPVPATSPTPNPVNDGPHRLRFEELTCDVELQHPAASKQQPVQFSFTLYDLDGHGRMTKDDIAGIVSTIYEAIGKSVIVPHYGSKTIQVRLTVIPEDGKEHCRDKREAKRRRRRREPTSLPQETQEYIEHSDDEERDRLSLVEDASSKSSCSVDRRPVQRPVSQRPRRQPRRDKRDRKNAKRRSGSLQRRELLEIIQANMEKNHLSFQASRKPCNSIVNEEETTKRYHKIRNRSYTVSEKPFNAFQKSKPEKSGPHDHLDLAAGGDSNLCRYDRYLHAVICSSARHAHTGYHQKQVQTPKHHNPRVHHSRYRSRSHEHPDPMATAKQPRVLQIIFL